MKAKIEKRLSCKKAPSMHARIDKSAMDKKKAGNCNLDLDLDRPEFISAPFLRCSLSHSDT